MKKIAPETMHDEIGIDYHWIPTDEKEELESLIGVKGRQSIH